MMKNISRIIVAVGCACAFAGCAKYETEDTLTAQKRVREAWMRVHYGDAIQPEANGLYILDQQSGTGEAVKDSSYCFVDYYMKDLDGNYVKYTTADMAKRMGTYSDTAYYSPKIWKLGDFDLYTPVQNILKEMKVGGHIQFLLPPDLTYYEVPKSLKNYYKTYGITDQPQGTENYIYAFVLKDVPNNMQQYERNQLKAYAAANYPGLDTLEDGFYFIKTKAVPEADTVADNATVKVRYVCKLLDGFCFDTNIADTAKVYKRYNAARTYSALSVS